MPPSPTGATYFRLRVDPCFWESALPAADFEDFAERPSRITFEADEAVFFDVTLVVFL
jgi:hypothetical protein